MSEAHAKMHLCKYACDDDMGASIAMMLHSFIMAQKFSDLMRNEAIYQTIWQRQCGGTEKGDGGIDNGVLTGTLE
eukprot:5961905-Ditylum_brightwellii.AAC.1